MKLFKPSIELVVFRNALDLTEFEIYSGHDVEQLLRQAFGGNGLSKSARLYHGDLTNDVTPKTPQDVDRVMRLHGRIYAVVKPMGVETLIAIGVSILVSVAIAFLMPVPVMPNASNQPPSPNNALAARTNKQRLGGRIPDIYGTVWSVPDLIAPTYSVYINNREVEFSYMCVGRGRFNVTEALDDTTPINQVFGSSVYVYDPDDSLNDTPDFLFGSAMTPDEAALSRLAVKRYTSVNGQLLPPPDNYLSLDKAVFRAGGIVEQSGFGFVNQFNVGDALTIEQPQAAESANGITEGDPAAPVTYLLNGIYVVAALTDDTITLTNPAAVNADWQKLADNSDYTKPTESVVSTQSDALWQGWFYTNDTSHEYALTNIVARNGLYNTDGQDFIALGLRIEIESEIVDSTNNPVAGTLELHTHTIYGNEFKKYASNNGAGEQLPEFNAVHAQWLTTNDEIARSVGETIKIDNAAMAVGKRLRFRVRRSSKKVIPPKGWSLVQDLRVADFYGARLMTAADAPKGVTTVYTKTLATEGALSLKERKLRLLVQRYVQRALTSDGNPNLLKFENMEVWDNTLTKIRAGYFQDDRTLIIPEPDVHGQSAVFDFVAVQTGNTYTLSFQETNEPSYIVGFILYDADKNIIEDPNLISGNLNKDFQYYRGYYSRSNKRATIRIDSDRVVFLRPRVGVYNSGVSNTDSYFKNIKFELGASVTPWTHFADDLLVLSNRADDILRHIATDEKIGNLQLSQVDTAQIKTEVDNIVTYFGTEKCAEFCGTFDDNNLSAEETMAIVAKSVFSIARRMGNKIELQFERKVPASVAIFNSHNILPETFSAPQSLGIANDYDGVKIEYTDPIDDAIITMSYPNDLITNPHEDKLIGVRNKEQAHIHMMRMYNKDRHAYKSCEFVAGDESNIVVRTNRITVADQLRANVQQGSVDSIETVGSEIVLHTTDPVTINDSVPHTLFIQTINNGVESIAVTARDDYSVKLARLPSGEISSGYDAVVQAVYQIVSEADSARDAYLVTQKDPGEGMTNKLTCTNYDDRYYQNDTDHINGLIT